MPVYRDEVVVLRTTSLGEADRIVTLLGREHGRIRAVAKGVRRSSSRWGMRLEPFMVADVQLAVGRSLDIVTQAVTLAAYAPDLVDDYATYATGTAMLETADRLAEHEATPEQHLLLVGALRALARRDHAPELILDSYLLRAFSLAGWRPSFDACAVTGEPGPHQAFVPQLGGLVTDRVAPPGSARLDLPTIGLLEALLVGDWGVADASGPLERSRASGAVGAFAQWHLERALKSLDHVAQARSDQARSDQARSDQARSGARAEQS